MKTHIRTTITNGALLLLLAACSRQPAATATPSDPHAHHAHPAAAPASAPPAPAGALRPDAFDAAAPIAVSEARKAATGGGHEGHQVRGITPGEDRENPPTPMAATRDRTTMTATTTASTATTPAHDHSQHGTARGAQQTPAAATVYVCPMHPEVTSDKPGECPKCGMDLVKKE